MKKRILITVVCTLLCFICACSQNEVVEDVPEWEADGDGIVDFNGRTFYLSADIDKSSQTFLSYFKDTLFGDAAMKRFAEVEDQYNCKLEPSKTVKAVGDILLHASAGITDIDFYVEHMFTGGNQFKVNGVLLPMSAVSDIIDLNDTYKWGTPNLLEEFVYEDEVYGVLPMAWPENNILSLDFLLVFNSNFTTRLSLEDPRDYLENGKWTMDQFEQTLHDYTFTDDFGNHVYAFGFDSRHLIDMSLRAYGANLCERDSSGKWVSGYYSEAANQAMDWAKKIAYSPEFADCVIVKGCSDQVPMWSNNLLSIGFLTMNYTLWGQNAGTAESAIVYTGIPFALLPFPSLDGSTVLSQHERTINAIMLPAWASDSDATATVIDAIFEPIAGLETEEDMIDYYANNLFFDRRDAELLFKMQKVSRYLFHNEGVNDLNRNIYTGIRSSTPSETFSKYSGTIDTLLENQIIPVKEGMYELFGFEN